ncbi:MAG: transcriptional repressor [Deltaproteobacteria bacterium]|nr:MAG: transcriptional repressor [Deltaproteobacteria bacterium]
MIDSSPAKTKRINERLAEFESVCRQRGLRLTHQRRELYLLLLHAVDHPSAETLYERLRLKLPTVSLDTVYRNLHTLETHGLITRVPTGKSQARFEARKTRHHHLICSRCGEISDIQWESFDRSNLPDQVSSWGRVNDRQAILTGICHKCLNKN